MTRRCSVDGCERVITDRHLMCGMHRSRLRKHGELGPPGAVQIHGDLPARFWSYVDKTEECWLWCGALTKGYGVFSVNRRNRYAHRVAYELVLGPIPADLEIDHLCRNRTCVNPDHLEPVTHEENTRRAFLARTHCPRGHPYDEQNTYLYRGKHRQCRACWKLRDRRRSA